MSLKIKLLLIIRSHLLPLYVDKPLQWRELLYDIIITTIYRVFSHDKQTQ